MKAVSDYVEAEVWCGIGLVGLQNQRDSGGCSRNRIRYPKMTKYFTDYPVEQFGDRPHHAAPFRPCVPIAYAGDKYVVCDVKEGGTSCRMTIKSGYIKKTRSKNPKSVVRHRHLLHLEVDLDTFWALQDGE